MGPGPAWGSRIPARTRQGASAYRVGRSAAGSCRLFFCCLVTGRVAQRRSPGCSFAPRSFVRRLTCACSLPVYLAGCRPAVARAERAAGESSSAAVFSSALGDERFFAPTSYICVG
eukprot:3620732-Pyramimonas_sp.AAC.1